MLGYQAPGQEFKRPWIVCSNTAYMRYYCTQSPGSSVAAGDETDWLWRTTRAKAPRKQAGERTPMLGMPAYGVAATIMALHGRLQVAHALP
jgi:hypothetical protein